MSSPKNDKRSLLSSVIRHGIENYMKDVHTAMPGKIEEFDSEKQIATVQPLIKRKFKNKEAEDLPLLLNVPVWQPKAGNFSITFPIKKGDECLIIFSERSIDNWLFDGESKAPNDNRTHSLSDAICYVGMSSIPNAIQNYETEGLQFRNSEKDATITIFENKNIEIKTGTNVVVLDNENNTVSIETDKVNVKAATEVNFDTPIAKFTGDVEITGTSTADDHLSGSNNISGKDHTHKILSGSSSPGPTDVPE